MKPENLKRRFSIRDQLLEHVDVLVGFEQENGAKVRMRHKALSLPLRPHE